MTAPKSSLVLAAWVLLLLASAADAADLKARVAAIDLEKGTIALTAADQEQSYELAKDCKVYQKSGGRKDSGYAEATGGLKAINVGDDVTATTDPVDGHEQVTRLKIESLRKKGRHPGRDISGKVAAIDLEKRTIGLSKTDKEQTYALAKDCNVYKLVGSGSQAHFIPAVGGLSEVTEGVEVVLNLDKREGREQVIYIEIGAKKNGRSQ
jgi:archaellin